MARVDAVILKTSDYSQQDLFKAITGETTNGPRPERLESGEIVMRFTGRGNLIDIETGEEILDGEGNPIPDKPSGVELWTLNQEGDPTQIRLDLSAELPEYDLSANIGQVSLTDLKDVNIEEPAPSQVLTWDGANWVNRDLPEFGGEGAIIPTLNEVGDVNYGGQAANNKFGPEVGDVLFYQYDGVLKRNVWIPYKLEVELIDGFNIRDKQFVIDRYKANTVTIGNPLTSSSGEARFGLEAVPKYGGSGLGYSWDFKSTRQYSGIVFGSNQSTLYQCGSLVMVDQSKDLENPESGQIFRGIKYESEDAVPAFLPDRSYLTTLVHVKNEIERTKLGELENVNDVGILQGQVLGWDSLSQEYRPLSGVSPDLGLASIEDLNDVTGREKHRGKPLTWSERDQMWAPVRVHDYDILPGYYEDYSLINDPTTELPFEDDPNKTGPAPACDEDNLGRIAVFDNEPHVCLRCRKVLDEDLNNPDPEEESNPNYPNTIYGYVKVLLDGYNTPKPGGFSPEEYRAQSKFPRRDSLSSVAYEGSLGALYNVSTADVFPGASVVYNDVTQSFEMGYPALYLPDYSIGELGDVYTVGAGVGYGLLWDGNQWVASSLDQQIRLDDLQDVQFGSLGVQNTKLVAAYMMSPSSALGSTYYPRRDVSTVLAVSTPKADLAPGTTAQYEWAIYEPGQLPAFGGLAPTQGGAIFEDWRRDPAFSTSEWLALYISWANDQSWQTIDGDGCMELFIYPKLLLDDRTILKKNIVFAGSGGYILQLTQAGGLFFQVIGPGGSGGFTIQTPVNIVSTNNWHHIAIVKQGASNRLYLDGYKVGEAPSAAAWTGDGLFVLGRNDLNDNNTLKVNGFRGYMSDFRVTKGRFKYEGEAITIPTSIEAEIIDTSPQAGDFLSYDGTKWTNVNGVEGDISNKSINELADVDTATNNPASGDALVWTGAQWEPGIPGIGATWSLDDMTDVETFYQSAIPYIKWSQAEAWIFSDAFVSNKEDNGYMSLIRNGTLAEGQQWVWKDCDYSCRVPPPDCGSRGPYGNSDVGYVRMLNENLMEVRTMKLTIKNDWTDCTLAAFEYHEDALYYSKCPDRNYGCCPNPYGDIPDEVEDEYIPCWGVIEDHIEEALAYGRLEALKNVNTSAVPTLGQALAWTGNEWAPSSDIAADISENSIGDLADVTISGALAGHALKYDGSMWRNGFVLESLTELPDVDALIVESFEPITHTRLRDWEELGYTRKDEADEIVPISTYDSTALNKQGVIADIGEEGIRGFGIGTRITSTSDSPWKSYWFNNQNYTTVLTSVLNMGDPNLADSVGHTWLELHPKYIRFSGEGAKWGEEGFLIGDNLILRYENTARTIGDYGEHDVMPKGLTLDYVDNGLQNLDLSRNILENLGNVSTPGKLEGWALIWDGTNWVASPSVAADISLSSIGDLVDVTKVQDESITFDVPKLLTTAPGQTNGGLELTSSDGNARIGWSDVVFGTPHLENITGTYTGSLACFLSVEPQQIRVGGDGGLLYDNEPGLSELTVPCFRQVKQQIVRELTDYNALFFLNGENFVEQNYGWQLDVQVTTQPNPAYFSKFDGSSSLSFRKLNQDKILWTTANGCPFEFSMGTLWAFEFWVYVSDSDAGDGYNEFILSPVGNNPANGATGIHFGITGNDRSKFFWTNDAVAVGSGGDRDVPRYGLGYQGEFNKWIHMVLQQEGSGLMRWYVDGYFVGEKQTNKAPEFEGGMSIGGRERPTGADTGTYLSAFIDDLRITKGWLPYEPGQNSYPVPIEPLPPGAFKATFGSLNSLSDVNTENPAPINGNVLMWDNVAQQWKAGPADGLSYDISGSVLTDLSDVNTENQAAAENDILAWNTISDQWERTRVDGNGGVRPINARSATPGAVPQAGTLFAGEIFINMSDKIAYSLDDAGQPFVWASENTVEGILGTVDRVVAGTF